MLHKNMETEVASTVAEHRKVRPRAHPKGPWEAAGWRKLYLVPPRTPAR